MGDALQFWHQGDAVTRAVALVLLAMSISAWVLIVWKAWLLTRVRTDLTRAVPAFWAAPDLSTARQQLAAFDREAVLAPLLSAATDVPAGGTLDARGERGAQLTRRLRDALHRVLAQLQTGQVVLASIGSTAPFVGLFGTVWGIYHALLSIAAAGTVTIDAPGRVKPCDSFMLTAQTISSRPAATRIAHAIAITHSCRRRRDGRYRTPARVARGLTHFTADATRAQALPAV